MSDELVDYLRTKLEPIESIAKRDAPHVQLHSDQLDRIAHLAIALTQAEARRHGVILSPYEAIPYNERPEDARASARRAIVKVIQALEMLGYLDLS